ncbi:LytTR family DNA-binding domain-containing protein [Sphingomonas glaciei]|uniref:LytTR family transcriptional regulator n=1 Tax=Sphingomonas glaciei TaxID=2938948 RepID=A0ABY5MV25_9SPHN|nr:LytTR family DNA-binding domain-containing protein [Sphingomonas glaciei]UUR07590.1 LytTR family transcriptional regulator [Sphingomonas glaciei]
MTRLNVVVCLAFDHRASVEGLGKFKECVLRCPFVESAMEVTGTFDLIVQGSCDSLTEYTQNMELIRPQLAQYVSRLDANFISKKVEVRSGEGTESALWLPCDGGRRRVEACLIDKVVAEGDYMRVHVGKWNCLVHLTMQRLYQTLGHSGFIKLHRSWLVRVGFIDRVIHEKHRWLARLRDGTNVTVAKSHVHDVLQLMTAESSTAEVNSAIRSQRNDGASPIEEESKISIS